MCKEELVIMIVSEKERALGCRPVVAIESTKKPNRGSLAKTRLRYARNFKLTTASKQA